MTLPDPGPRRQPHRLGLYAPFVALLVFAIGWSSAWLWLRGEVGAGLASLRASLGRSGYRLNWTQAAVSGYPFRLDLRLSGLDLREPSGRRLAVPLVKAEALMLTPAHWVIEVPSDIAVTRPNGESVTIRSDMLRASLSDAGAHPPRVSIEAIGLRVIGAAGANPLFFSAARELHVHTRAGPNDQGAAYVEADAATLPPSGLAGEVAGGRPATLVFDAIYSHAGDLRGTDWPAMVGAWRDAGGALSLRAFKFSAGDVQLDARPGALGVDADGRLKGALGVTLRGGPRALAAMVQAGAITRQAAEAASSVLAISGRGPAASVTLDFQAGQTTLGPVAIGPAPKVY